MTEHDQYRDKLSSYLDNALGNQEKEAVKGHLGRCGNCREVLADLEWAAEQVKRLPEVEAPPWLVPLIMKSIKETALTSVPDKFLVPLRVKVLLGVAVLVIAVLGITYHEWTQKKGVVPNLEPQVKARPAAPAAVKPPVTAVGSARNPQPRMVPQPSPPTPLSVVPSVPSSPVSEPVAAPVTAPAPVVREMPELQPSDHWSIPVKEQ